MNLKHIIRYPFDIRLAEEQLASKSGQGEQWQSPAIGLDLYSDRMLIDCGRHLSCLAALAQQIESRVVLRCGRVLLAAIAHKSHGRKFLAMPHVSWIDPGQRFPADSLVLLDIDGAGADRILHRQRTVAMAIGREAIAKTLVMPYPMHPNQIEQLTPERLQSLRSGNKAGIFFAGNQKRRYGREAINDRFGVLSRLEILAELRRQFADRIAPREAAGVSDRIVLRNSATDPIAAQDWMSVLAAHQFFLCCPGAAQPICHNVIEAMSVGVIPIIEYGDRFHPELVDGDNAICFHGRDGLAAAIRRIDSMSAEKRARLSQNVSAYYDQYLDGARVVKRLRDELNTDFVDQVSMPFHDENLFSIASPPSGRVPAIRSRAA